jgi:hypothetical protein
MALAPADFAAYSRATGTPYPEDPEEKAQLAPSVAEFRRNQLQAPQQESNLPGILGATALGLGALAGGIGLATALGRTKASVASSLQSDLTPKGRSDVAVVDRYARQRAAEDLTRQARSERPAGVVQADLSNVQVKRSLLPTEAEALEQYSRRLSQDFPEPTASEMEALNAPSRTSEILARLGTSPQYRPDPKDINYTRFGPPSPEVAAARREQASQDLLRFAQQRQEDAALVTNQTIGALESGEDQMTGRTMMGVQRNEDLDASQVNNVARQTGSADVAASMTPDGVPVDQAEGRSGAMRFLERERMEIASQLGEQGIPITPSRVEIELSNRLGKEAYEYGPKYTARRQNLELYAQTGTEALLNQVKRFGLSPVTFETFENMPAAKRTGFESAPTFTTSYYPGEELEALGLSSNIEIDMPGAGRVNLADVRKPVITESTALAAEEFYQNKKEKALDWLGDLRVQLEPKRNQILKERRLLAEERANELMPQLQQAKEAGQFDLAQDLQGQLQNLRALWKNPELGTHRQDELRLLNAQIKGAQQKIQEGISGIEKRYPTTLRSWSGEADRVFGELDVETGEFIPETMELRSERKMVDLKKGGGGRNVAEFTAGERLDEEIRKVQGGGRIRDYDPETGAAASQYADDRTQTGREIDIYGERLSSQPKDDPELKPTDVQIPKAGLANPYSRLDGETLNQMALMGDPADQYNAEKELSRRKIAGAEISLGGIQSTRESLIQLPTEAARRSVLMSEAVLKAARQQASRNPRGGILPDETTQLRMKMAQLEPSADPVFTRRPPGPRPGTVPPQQLALKGVSGFKSRQTKSPADAAAEQLENYMSKLQRGRSTPLTSEAVIQPRLF